MSNGPITLDEKTQRSDLLVDLYAQLHGVSKALIDLSKKASDPTYDPNKVNDLILEQNLLMARIEEIKNGAAFKFPSDSEIEVLGKACDALAKIDATTATAEQILKAANAVLSALPKK